MQNLIQFFTVNALRYKLQRINITFYIIITHYIF